MTPPELRIGDRERDAAVAALGEHYVAGRLTKEEYDERTAVAWQARTNSDLVPLFRDLPPLRAGRAPASVPAGPVPGRPQATRPVSRRSGFRFPLLPVLLVLVGLALLDLGWMAFVLVGVLWCTGAFRWLHRAGARHHPRS